MQKYLQYHSTYERLLKYADSMKIIDTHEHLHPHNTYLGEQPDVLCDYFHQYISSDLQAAGMPNTDVGFIQGVALGKVCDYKLDLIERFKILEPWLDCVKNTSYYRSLEIAAKKIHGVKEISIKTIEELNEKFKKAASQKDYGRHIMKDICNIEVSINDNWSGDMKSSTTDLFVPTWQPNAYLNYTAKDDAPYSEIELQIEKLTLDEYCEAYKRHFLKQKSDGMKTLKVTVAYWRPLYFEDVGYDEAKILYDETVKTKIDFPRKLQDYMMHFILKVADENNFAIQIHTGLQEGMRNNLENSNPMLLQNLFGKYPNLTFDIFHMGYPYERELMVLAKTHPNVYIDLCWAHIISPFASRNAFYEMLDVLPYTKILGFGGDYLFFDGVVGHITLAKHNICAVLAEKVCNGECDIDLAEKILQSVLHDNAKRVFKL